MKNKRQPIYFTASNGKKRVSIKLANNKGTATLDRADFEALREVGYSGQFVLNSNGNQHNYVRASQPGRNLVTIARVLTGASKEQHIHYLDKNPINLTRENLEVAVRGSNIRPECFLCNCHPLSETL